LESDAIPDGENADRSIFQQNSSDLRPVSLLMSPAMRDPVAITYISESDTHRGLPVPHRFRQEANARLSLYAKKYPEHRWKEKYLLALLKVDIDDPATLTHDQPSLSIQQPEHLHDLSVSPQIWKTLDWKLSRARERCGKLCWIR
jgi:hypothetical protein